MSLHDFMTACKRVREGQVSEGFAAQVQPDGRYHNTPFQVQTGPGELAAYWDRIKLQQDITLTYKVPAGGKTGSIGHRRVEYQVLFRSWAKSTGTGLPDRPRRPAAAHGARRSSTSRVRSRGHVGRAVGVRPSTGGVNRVSLLTPGAAMS